MQPHLYLSPHLDDAALSCGGLIARQVQSGQRALIVTLFAGDPPAGIGSAFAAEKARIWQAEGSPAARRRAEDRAASERLGAAWLHWEYPDCIFRHDPWTGEAYYPSEESLWGPPNPKELAALAAELARRLQALCEQEHPVAIYAPLAVGHHVDHQIALAAVHRIKMTICPLCYYEDYPYAEKPGALQTALDTLAGAWQPEIEPLTPEALTAKMEAIACYRSQMPDLFGDEAAMRRRVAARAQTLANGAGQAGAPLYGLAERYWRRPVTGEVKP